MHARVARAASGNLSRYFMAYFLTAGTLEAHTRHGLPLGSVFKDHRVVDHGGVIRRHELTNQEWELLAPLIPRAATGSPRVSDRQIINGMVYKIRTGISWRDLPERYGPWQTLYTRFRRYALAGMFTRALQQIQARADAAGDIDWLVQIDSTIVRAHQHAAATGRTNRTITPSADPEAD
ncbi:IS5 family transposase [Streptomyces sp. NPDC058605]|uniref:IS5 family transposase n=1 Tax=unclassified Streptomyces TaxID=2593676 RepID=UPI0036610220